MLPYVPGNDRGYRKAKPSEELRIAVTFRRPQDGIGPTKATARLSAASALSFQPEPYDVDRALHELHRRGFKTTARGRLTASVRGTRAQFEKVFGTKLETVALDQRQAYQFHSFYFPPADAAWNPDSALMELIDDAYIQWPHIYMAKPVVRRPRPRASARAAVPLSGPLASPPSVPYWHLDVPGDLDRLLGVPAVHRAGTTGRGVRIAMIDTGFFHSHPFFPAHGYRSSIVLAAGATNRDTDPKSHGTGESVNIFSVAPGATFIGVKQENDEDPDRSASILEGFQEALTHDPHVISVSFGSDLRDPDGVHQLTALPNNLKALEVEVQAAVARGVCVVFSAGNGHYGFPAQMPDVIAAGGVFVAADGSMTASDYASSFESAIYSGRSVPDVSGLVGMLPHADYITLPVPPNTEIDSRNAAHDGTPPDDGWAVFSGTSASAPQIAGLCALLLEKNPGLKPADVKAILRRSAREVKSGHANPMSDPARQGRLAADGATGAGLVDAFAAWQQA